MNRYGQSITWGTPAAPAPFSGTCTGYTYRMALQRQIDEDNVGENRVLIQHSRKAEVSFDAKVTDASTDFLDLSAGGAVVLSGLSTGVLLATRAVERWALSQAKTISFHGTHFPDIVQASPVLAGTAVTAFTPAQSLSFLHPGGKLIYGTAGLTHASGILHMLEVTQELQITEDEPDPTGVILGAASHGYLRTASLDILSTAAAPAEGSVLTVTGATTPLTATFRIESVETKFAEKRGKMYALTAVWIPPLG